jgi:hypothetical protein
MNIKIEKEKTLKQFNDELSFEALAKKNNKGHRFTELKFSF